jgi:hypothetical protein
LSIYYHHKYLIFNKYYGIVLVVEQKEYLEMAKVSDNIRDKMDDGTFSELFVATPIPTVEEIDEREKGFRDERSQERDKNNHKLTWALVELDRELPDLKARRQQVATKLDGLYEKRNSRLETRTTISGVVGMLLGLVGFVCMMAFHISLLFPVLGVVLLVIALLCWADAELTWEKRISTEELRASLNDYPHCIPDEIASLVAHVHKRFYGCVSFEVKHTVSLSYKEEKEYHKQRWSLGYEKQKLKDRQLLAEHPQHGFPELSVTIEGWDSYTIAVWE